MKKLLTLCGVTLILALMSGPAYPLSFGLDIDQDGTVDIPTGAITLSESETMAIDIYAVGWDEPVKGNLCSVLAYFEWDTGSIELESYSLTDPFWNIPGNTLTAGKLSISHANDTGGAAGPNVYLQTVVIHCLAAGTDWVELNMGADGVFMPCTGFGAVTDVATLNVVVNQLPPPPCDCDVTPDNPGIIIGSGSQQFAGNPGVTCGTPNYSWDHGACAEGSVDGSGLFTSANPITAEETCTITATDSANTDGQGQPVTCSEDIDLMPAAGCATKIYKGGYCEEAEDLDTVYNRPGRRGLSITCCEEEQFCVCSSCDPVETCFSWTTEIVSGGGANFSLADLVADSGTDTSFTLKVADPCTEHCPAEVVELEVCVESFLCAGNPVGVPEDCVIVQIGRVALGVSNENAHPDTQTTDIELLLWNPENHVKAVQADICTSQHELFCIDAGRGGEEACGDQNCGLITVDTQCGNPACDGLDEGDCGTTDNCWWNAENSICWPVNYECYELSGAGEATCNATAGCDWVWISQFFGYCPPAEGHEFCKWKTVGGVDQCVNMFDCVWTGTDCVGDDNMVCTECVVDEDRSAEFVCSANEQANGCCRVTLYTTEPDDLIQRGDGAVARIKFDVGDSLSSKDCVELIPTEIKISDQFNEFLCAVPKTGEICFRICGDVYPQDCYECANCGDGVVDLFDILEEIDIVLGLQMASKCQMLHGDVPLGMPPYCGNPGGVNPPNCEPDGVIDIFDALVIIDKALSRMNCCDYCMFGQIY